jgi:hypothetical protein
METAAKVVLRSEYHACGENRAIDATRAPPVVRFPTICSVGPSS